MKAKLFLRSSLAVCGIVFAALTAPAHAGLVGDTVTCAQVGSGSFSCGVSQATVGSGVEFQIGTTIATFLTADFSDSELVLTAATEVGLTATILEFTNSTSAFTSASFVSATGITGLDASDITLPSGVLSIDLRETRWDQGEVLRVSLTDGGSGVVPEPASLALAGLGFAALALSRTRRLRAGAKIA